MSEKWKKLTIDSLSGGFTIRKNDTIENDKYSEISKLQLFKPHLLTTIARDDLVFTDAALTSSTFLPHFAYYDGYFYFALGTHLFKMSDDLETGIAEDAGYAAINTAGSVTDLAVYNNSLYIGKTDCVITKTGAAYSKSVASTPSQFVAAHGRLYFMQACCSDDLYYYDGGPGTIVSLTAPSSVVNWDLALNPINNNVLFGDYEYNGTSFSLHHLSVPYLYKVNNNSRRFEEPSKFLSIGNNQVGFTDGRQFQEIPIIKELIQYCSGNGPDDYRICSFQRVGNFYLIGFFENVVSPYNSTFFLVDPIKNIAHFLYTTPTHGAAYNAGFLKSLNAAGDLYVVGSTVTSNKIYCKIINFHLPTPWEVSTYDLFRNFATQGYFITPPMSFGNPHEETLIKAISVNTVPLPAGTSVKIYLQKEFAGAYDLILTHDTTSSAYKEVNFETCKKFHYGKFKVELNGTTTLKPDLYNVNILYKKKGL
jgi:hypothetical protein